MKKSVVSFLVLGSCFATISFADTAKFTSSLHPALLIQKKVTALKSSHVLDLTNLIAGSSYSLAIKDPATGVISYTRNGYFLQKADGYYYQDNKRLQGYPMDGDLTSNACTLTDVKSPMGAMPAQAASIVEIERLNLNASDNVPQSPIFNPSDVQSYNFTTTAALYDKLDNIHTLNMYYIKRSANNWDVNIYVDGTSVAMGTLEFNADGTLYFAKGFDNVAFTLKNASDKQVIKIDLNSATQYASSYEAIGMLTDGYASGDPIEDVVDPNGYISVFYSNNMVVTFSKIAVFRQ